MNFKNHIMLSRAVDGSRVGNNDELNIVATLMDHDQEFQVGGRGAVLLLVTQTKLSTGVGTDYRGSDGCNNILL